MNPDNTAAKKRAIRLLTSRDRTEYELRERLSAEYEPYIVEEVLAYLREMGYVDDARYARNFVEHCNRLRPTGNVGLRHQLTAKGIPASIVDQVLNSEEVELELAKGLLLQRAPAYQNLDRERRLRRAYSLLERRGFRWQTAHAAVTQVPDSDLQKD